MYEEGFSYNYEMASGIATFINRNLYRDRVSIDDFNKEFDSLFRNNQYYNSIRTAYSEAVGFSKGQFQKAGKNYNVSFQLTPTQKENIFMKAVTATYSKYGIEQVFNLDFYYFKYREERTPKNFYNEMFDNFYKSLPESKRLWKSEYKLFLLVKNSYPDAIYQYCNPIFKGLIIDIYIPSLRIAIEYQGEQHYHVIERFSDNLLSERKENDNLKRKLCIDNNIQLIEWKYDELISKLNLDKKINELNMK